MKGTIISLSTILTCLTLSAQEPPRPAAGGWIGERFKQLDRNSDGKLMADEVPREQLFKMLDRNGDGVLTLEEAKTFGGADRRAAKRQSEAAADLPPA